MNRLSRTLSALALASHAALAIQSAQESAESSRHRNALEQLLRVSSRLTETFAIDAILQAVCDGIHHALGFETVSVDLPDPDTGNLEPRAAYGWELDDPAVHSSFTLAEIAVLLVPEFETQGCYLLTSEQARARVRPEADTYSSQRCGKGPHAWNDHWLIVPLYGRSGELIGLIWADDPVDLLVPSPARLQALRVFANQATTALDAAAQFEEMEFLADHDPLTRLRNRRSFVRQLELETSRSDRYGRRFALLVGDVNGFKQVNDRRGHPAGDRALESLGRVLMDGRREVDGVYRIGGDEFALIVHDRRAVDTLYLVQHLQTRMTAASETWPVSASGGVAESCKTLGRDGLIRRADLALIQAKRSHRRCLLYNEALEPTLSTPDQAAEQRHTDALATALARAVDAKDAYTHSHCETVSELCGLIAQELGMGARHIGRLRLAGLLHDVGKIGITDTILQKPGPLTDDEFAVMKTHTRLGHAIVSAAERPIEAGWILHHHERIDGGGYPDGLTGDQIPLESRIILVADAFEAITADRPYRMHRSADAAMIELERNAGTQFDRECVAALGRVVQPHLRQAA